MDSGEGVSNPKQSSAEPDEGVDQMAKVLNETENQAQNIYTLPQNKRQDSTGSLKAFLFSN